MQMGKGNKRVGRGCIVAGQGKERLKIIFSLLIEFSSYLSFPQECLAHAKEVLQRDVFPNNKHKKLFSYDLKVVLD